MEQQEHVLSRLDSTIAWLLLFVLFALTPLFPQLVSPGFSFFYRSAIVLLFCLIAYRSGTSRLLSTIAATPVFWPGLAILGISGIGLAYTPDVYHAKAKLAMLCCALLLYWVIAVVPWSEKVERILYGGLALGGLAAAVHAVYAQWVGPQALLESLQSSQLYPEEMQQEMVKTIEANRASGNFGNPNQLAGYLVLSLWPLWMLWKNSSYYFARIVYAAAGLAIAFGVYRTFSRSGLACLLATLILFALYELYERGYRITPRGIAWIGGICAVAAAVVILVVPAAWFGDRLLTISTLVARTHFYRGAVCLIRDHPMLGSGTEGFESYYCAYLRPGDLEAQYVHNSLLETSAEHGVAGTFVYFWLLGVLIVFLYKCVNRIPRAPFGCYAALGAVTVFWLLSMADFHNNLMEMWTVPAVLFGFASRPSVRGRSPVKQGRFVWVLVSVVLSVWGFCVFARYWNEIYRQSGYYYSIDNRLSQARFAYENAVLYDRTDAESWDHLASIWARIPTPESRIRQVQCLEHAVEWAPRRASIRANYAEALFALGYTERAIEEMRRAQALFPARPAYHERLAALYRALGWTKEADEEIIKAEQLKQVIEAKKI